MNWQIHSGITGIWDISSAGFNMICGVAFKECADFGMLCTKFILKDFGFDTALEGLKKEWDNIRLQRNLAYVEAQNKINESGTG